MKTLNFANFMAFFIIKLIVFAKNKYNNYLKISLNLIAQNYYLS